MSGEISVSGEKMIEMSICFDCVRVTFGRIDLNITNQYVEIVIVHRQVKYSKQRMISVII